MSSPPPTATPSPLAIGRTFLKQFYHVVSTTPDMIYKFYNPSSVLSHGEGSNPTTPTTMESLKDPKDLKDRFFSWATNTEDPVRFELENGAIDAQESINGGVLLVVTGHMYLGDHTCRPFCHTFFLHPFSPPNSTKRSYYVHNDVLRFLQVENTAVSASPVLVAPAEPAIQVDQVDEATDQPADEAVVTTNRETQETDEPIEETKEMEPPAVEVALEAPVEESKAEPIADGPVEESKEETIIPEETKESEIFKQRKSKGKKNGKSEQPPASPKPPLGSWASLVASSADKPIPAPIPAPVVIVPPPTPPTEPAPTPAPLLMEQPEATTLPTDAIPTKSTSDHVRRHRRDPDHTLVIKNVPDSAKEGDIRNLFEQFAAATNTKVVGITVSAHRGLAFVDYDASSPVVAALESSDRPFSLNGRVLDLEQKTMDVQRRAARGGPGSNSGRNFPPTSSSSSNNPNFRGNGENGTPLRGQGGGRGSGPRRGGRDGRVSGDRGPVRGGGRGGR